MNYEIKLVLTHVYAGEAASGRHLIRVLPAHQPGRQDLLSGQINAAPAPNEQHDQTDFFGNRVRLLVHRAAHREMEISASARVRCHAVSGGLDMSPRLRDLPLELARVTGLDARSPHHFLGPSPRIQRNAAMAEYARALVRSDMTVHDAVLTIGRALHQDMQFNPMATTVDTSAEEAFERKEGVCQDFTHIMITCLRALGIPAGYVSGFLRTHPPAGQARLEGADAMHAWVQAWAGCEMGWIEFDPTNSMKPSQDHILVARGRDYSDIAPIRGVLRMAGLQASMQAVDVIPETVEIAI